MLEGLLHIATTTCRSNTGPGSEGIASGTSADLQKPDTPNQLGNHDAMTNGKRKLVAYLHDPPEKAYNYGPVHKDRAQQYLARVLGPGRWTDHQPDWAAAAADRFIFPDGQKLNALGLPGLGGGVQFIHPLTGKPAILQTDLTPLP